MTSNSQSASHTTEFEGTISELLRELARLRQALALESARLSMYRELAYHDDLTGLHNRRYFEERLSEELARADRTNGHLALVIVDLDDFKLINDLSGHATGDEVLRWVAGILGAERRTMDVACRIGGDEFAVILPATDVEGAEAFIARVRERLETEAGRPVMHPPLRVRLSMGACIYPIEAPSADELIQRADTAMYLDKEAHKTGDLVAA